MTYPHLIPIYYQAICLNSRWFLQFCVAHMLDEKLQILFVSGSRRRIALTASQLFSLMDRTPCMHNARSADTRQGPIRMIQRHGECILRCMSTIPDPLSQCPCHYPVRCSACRILCRLYALLLSICLIPEPLDRHADGHKASGQMKSASDVSYICNLHER